MKTTVMGIEISEGVSKKTGKPYAIGTLHTLTPLAPGISDQSITRGFAGDKYEAPPELLRKIQHLTFPVSAEVSLGQEIRYGQRVQRVTDIQPLEVARKAG